MKRNARNAFEALKKINAPVFESADYGCQFIIGGELRTSDDRYFADYWREELKEFLRPIKKGEDTRFLTIIAGEVCENPFGIRTDVGAILKEHGLYGEWINGGMLGVYEL